jgi:hypothetical protein
MSRTSPTTSLTGSRRGRGRVRCLLAGAKGLDTSNYTFGYVTGWADGNPDQVRDAAETVLGAARAILDQLPTDDDKGHDTEAQHQ